MRKILSINLGKMCMGRILLLLLAAMLVSVALAAAEEPPTLTGFQQFYGEVRNLPAGVSFSLVAKINNRVVATTQVAADGKYGYSPTFKVYGTAGSVISFSVFSTTETSVGSAPYQANAVTQLNFQYPQTAPPNQTVNVTPPPPPTPGNVSGNATGGIPTTERATVCWQCNEWGACRNGWQTRSCARFSPCSVQGPDVYFSEPADRRGCPNATAGTITAGGAASCIFNWECGAWSACQNNKQIRLCTRVDQCDRLLAQNPNLQVTRIPEPDKERSCVAPLVAAPAPLICITGSKRCLGNELQRCSSDGKEWLTAQVCPGECDPVALRCREAAAPPGVPPVQKPIPTWILPLVGSVVLVIVIVLVVMSLLSRRKYAPAKDYIESSREKGYDDAAIRARLINQGWDPQLVDKLMK